jgi:hypothetical protein
MPSRAARACNLYIPDSGAWEEEGWRGTPLSEHFLSGNQHNEPHTSADPCQGTANSTLADPCQGTAHNETNTIPVRERHTTIQTRSLSGNRQPIPVRERQTTKQTTKQAQSLSGNGKQHTCRSLSGNGTQRNKQQNKQQNKHNPGQGTGSGSQSGNGKQHNTLPKQTQSLSGNGKQQRNRNEHTAHTDPVRRSVAKNQQCKPQAKRL